MTVLALDYLSPTAVSRLLACEQRYTFQYLDGLREDGSEATATGIAFAEALEVFDHARALKAYEGARPPVDPIWDDADLRENERLLAYAIIKHAPHGYRERYREADIRAGVKREVEYIVQALPGKKGEPTPILYVRADGAGPTHLVEDKLRSGSSLGTDAIEQECLRGFQLTAEVYVHWRKTGELLPVKFRLVRKPNRTKTKAMHLDNAAIDEYVRDHFENNERAYDEREVTRTVEEMHRFEAELRRLWLRRADLLGGKQPVRNPSSCFSYGRVCPFAERCSATSS
jgi:hypothetical protein